MQNQAGGQFRESRWFRLPPKVRIVPGILGPHPSQVTRVVHPDSGMREVIANHDSEHRPPVSFFW